MYKHIFLIISIFSLFLGGAYLGISSLIYFYRDYTQTKCIQSARKHVTYKFPRTPRNNIDIIPIELGNYYDRFIKWNIPRLESRDPYIVKNNFLDYSRYIDIDTNVESGYSFISSYLNWLKNKDINAFYIIPPTKLSDENIYQNNIFSNRNLYFDKIKEKLLQNGFMVLDLREELRKDNISIKEAFYETDHHFKPEIGIWATHKIAEFANFNFGLSLDTNLISTNHFVSEIQNKRQLGSQGRFLTISRVSPEPFELLLYTGDINIVTKFPNDKKYKEGGYENLIFRQQIKTHRDLYAKNAYSAFLGGNNTHIYIKNNSSPNSTRVLAFSDSIDNVIVPPLSILVSQVLSIDNKSNFPLEERKTLKNDIFPTISTSQFDFAFLIYDNIDGDMSAALEYIKK